MSIRKPSMKSKTKTKRAKNRGNEKRPESHLSLKKRKRSSDATRKESDQRTMVDEELRRLLTGDDSLVSPSKKVKGQGQSQPEVRDEESPSHLLVAQDEQDSASSLRDRSPTLKDRAGVDETVPKSKPGSSLTSPVLPPSEEKMSAEDAGKMNSVSSPSAWLNQLTEAHAKRVKVTVILERANLETVRHNGRSSGVVLLNSDDHSHILRKTGRDANDARPDITHQCLLALQDSPLNKKGLLKVYVRTARNVLIDIHPQTRIPRTMNRFSGLMAEVLEKFKVRGTSGSTPLLKVIRNPVTSHLPVGARKIICTYNTENVVDIRKHAHEMAKLALPKSLSGSDTEPTDDDFEQHGETVNVVYVVGAMAHGKVTEDWADDYICVSEYPLSAATVCSRILYAYETLLGIM